jgi:hypothetical protein
LGGSVPTGSAVHSPFISSDRRLARTPTRPTRSFHPLRFSNRRLPDLAPGRATLWRAKVGSDSKVAAGMAGMVLVTVDPAFRARKIEYVLKQSRSSGVFVVSAFRGNPMLEIVRAVAPNFATPFALTTGMPSPLQATIGRSSSRSSALTIRS